MPFGLKNAPSTFQRVMDNVLREYLGKGCLVYMDDIIVYSTSLQEHIDKLRKVFNKLKSANLKIQLDKSEFLKKEVSFLGHLVTSEGVKPNPDKISAIKNFPLPKTPKQIKSFLGLIGYYRKFIPDFAKITKPMTTCLKKNAKIVISENYTNCFENCKTLLCNDPILQYPDFSLPFVLTTDASNVALGAVLSQGKIGSDKPICYASRTLSDSELNYSTIEKELLAIIWATKYFRPYLFGRKFKIITDHKPLTWLMSIKEPNSKLTRWRLKLEEYEYEIVYKKGCLNANADALSRVEINNEACNVGRAETFRDFIKYCRINSLPMETPFKEHNKSLLKSNDNIAHCVSSDLEMSKGIAQDIKQLIKNHEDLKSNTSKIGDVLMSDYNNKNIFHLVTKNNREDKPLYTSLFTCLIKLRQILHENKISSISLPKLGCGLDKLDWEKVKTMINFIFKDSNIIINIYHYQKLIECYAIDNLIRVNSNESLIVHTDDNETVHSCVENISDGIKFTDRPINTFNNQIIFSIRKDAVNHKISSQKFFKNKKRLTLVQDSFSEEDIINCFKKYFNFNKINCIICNCEETFKLIRIMHNRYFNKCKVLKSQLLLKDIECKDEQDNIISEYHIKNNHRGINETLAHLSRTYFFENIKSKITRTINNCETCLTNKYERNPVVQKFELTESPKKPLEILHVDIYHIDNMYILTILDKFSKFAYAQKIENRTSINVLETLIKFFATRGIPNKIITDNAKEFTSNLIKDAFKKYNIEHYTVTQRNSTGNSPVERLHSTITEIYRILDRDKSKSKIEKLFETLLTYNNSIHSATKLTPFEIINGHLEVKGILDIDTITHIPLHEYLIEQKSKFQNVKNLIFQRNQDYKENVIKKLNNNRLKPKDYEKNEIIFQRDNRRKKTAPLYTKHVVTKNLKNVIRSNKIKIHKSKIKSKRKFQGTNCNQRPTPRNPRPTEEPRIINTRTRNRKHNNII